MFFRKCMRDGIALSGTVFYFGFVIVLPSVLIIILKKNMERVQDKMNKSACMLLIIGIICIALCGCGEQMNLYGTPDCPELSWEERRELTMSYEEAENVWNKIERRLRTRYDIGHAVIRDFTLVCDKVDIRDVSKLLDISFSALYRLKSFTFRKDDSRKLLGRSSVCFSSYVSYSRDSFHRHAQLPLFFREVSGL